MQAIVMPPDVRFMKTSADALCFGVVLLAAALLAAWAMRSPLFSIRSIGIDGDVTRNSVSTIRANAAPRLAGNLFTLDLEAARKAFEAVPWVRRATLKRVWPDRLRVQIEEHRPAALWRGHDGSDGVVNTHGEVFEVNLGEVEDAALPLLSGPQGSAAAMLALAIRLAPALEPLQMPLRTLEQSGRGSWRAELASGASIELGRGSADEVIARAERFVRTAGQITAQYERPLVHADLRHAGGYAVRLKGVSTSAESKKPDRKH